MKITDTHVYFYSGREIYSNWHNIEHFDPVAGLTFANTEQNFMWYKADFFKDIETRDKIALEVDPRKVKGLGRQVKNYNEEAWKLVRRGFMAWPNYCKFSQIEDYGNQLKATDDKILVEASPFDCVWGVGLGENAPEILDESKWLGLNLLGYALMDVREMI